MAIYDCFQYFNEDHMVELRQIFWINLLTILISESKKHIRENQKINFDIKFYKI